MRTVIAIIFTTWILITAVCSSSKELNEKSARSLLKDQYAKVHYSIPVSLVSPLMTRMPVSYASVVDTRKTKQVKENVAVYIVKRLLDAKLVTETDPGGKESEAEFNCEWVPTDDGKLFPDRIPVGVQKGQAAFQLYDDGWRLAQIALS